MTGRLPALLGIIAALGAVIVTLSVANTSGEPVPSSATGCALRTYPPTASLTPWPTPPFTPYTHESICNDTAQAANDLHIVLHRESSTEDPLVSNAEGCDEPAITFNDSPMYTIIDIEWDTACVDPGEDVSVFFAATCSTPEPGCNVPGIECFYWTADGMPLPSESPPVPHPNPRTCDLSTPLPECPPREAPTQTYAPTQTPSQPTRTPGPTERDVPMPAVLTFCNDSESIAGDLHVHFARPFSFVQLLENAPGCPDPILDEEPMALDEWQLDIEWQPLACVHPRESVELQFYYACGGPTSPCIAPAVYCYTWTVNGIPLESDGMCPGIEKYRRWGDINCDLLVQIADAVELLWALFSEPFPGNEFCPWPTSIRHIEDWDFQWGDLNCDGVLDGRDVLVLIRREATLSVDQKPGCPWIEELVPVGPQLP